MISKGSYSRGKVVAEKVAERLGYECIERETLLKECSTHYRVSEIELMRAVYDGPDFWDQVSGGKHRFVAYVRAALLRRLRSDNLVYHGLAGQYFVPDVAHVLKARIIAHVRYRAENVARRDGVDLDQAIATVRRGDEKRRKWSRELYGIEVAHAGLYDMVLRVDRLTTDDAADLICGTATLKAFEATPSSRRRIEDLLVAAEVRVALVDAQPGAEVTCEDGHVSIQIREQTSSGAAVAGIVEKLASGVVGVESVAVSYPDEVEDPPG
jgi:cytidylate kinase